MTAPIYALRAHFAVCHQVRSTLRSSFRLRALGLLSTLAVGLSPIEIHAAVGRTVGSEGVSDTGSATYRIDLSTPPGVNGLSPSLALVYDSRSGNGLVGVGWDIAGLSFVQRCRKTYAQDGLTSVPRARPDDAYCLDGKRLRHVSGAYGAEGATYQTEIESFTRVVAKGQTVGGPMQFEAWTSDGRIYEYGSTVDSRFLIAGTSTPRTWALSKIRDRNGNWMSISYEADVSNGVYRPSVINYGLSSNNPSSPAARVIFTYEGRTISDQIERYSEGGRSRETRRLSAVESQVGTGGGWATTRRYVLRYEQSPTTGRSRLKQVDECVNGDCFSPTRFDYQNGVPGWGVASDQGICGFNETTGDFNGDGLTDLAYRPCQGTGDGYSSFEYRLRSPSGLLEGPYRMAPSISGPWWLGVFSWSTIRFRGNGVSAIMMPVNSGLTGMMAVAELDVPSGQFRMINTGIPNNPCPQTGYQSPACGSFPADIDGDGRDDWVRFCGPGCSPAYIVWHRNNGSGFDAAAPVPVPLDYFQSGVLVGAVDVNGDGRADLALNYQTSYGSDGGVMTAAVFVATPEGYVLQDAGGYMSDFNGDGCQDIIQTSGSELSIRYGNCGRSGAIHYFESPVPIDRGGITLATNPAFGSADYDGDGRRDLLVAGAMSTGWTCNWLGWWCDWQWSTSTSSSVYLLRYNGTGFDAPIDLGECSNWTWLSRVGATDVDGDELGDLSYCPSAGQENSVGNVRPHNGTGNPPDLLTRVVDGFGKQVAFVHSSIVRDAHTRAARKSYPVSTTPEPVYVVSSLSATADDGSVYSRTYSYSGFQRDVSGRGFLGFESRRAQDSRNGLIEERGYRLEFPFTGMRSFERLLQPDGNTAIVATTRALATLSYSSGYNQRFLPYVSQSTESRYGVGGGANGALLSTTTVQNAAPDAQSGVITDSTTTVTEATGGGGGNPGQRWSARIRITEIQSDSGNWCLGKPTATQVTRSHSGSGGTASTRVTTASWDMTMCRAVRTDVEPGNAAQQLARILYYDGFGNVSAETLYVPGVSSRTTSYSWTADGRFVSAVTDAAGQVTRRSWNPDGTVAGITNPKGLTTSFLYDAFGRRTYELRPDGTFTNRVLTACGSDSNYCNTGFPAVRMRDEAYSYSVGGAFINGQHSLTGFNGAEWQRFDRVTRDGAWQRRTWQYDALGRVVSESRPFVSSYTGSVKRQYDLVGREISAVTEDEAGNVIKRLTVSYDGLRRSATDTNGKTTVQAYNAIGQLARVTDHNGFGQSFDYEPFGNQVRVTDTAGRALVSASFNARGFRTSYFDADRGSSQSTYSPYGDLVATTDAKGQTIAFAYDALGRPVSRNEPSPVGGTITREWIYGASVASRDVGEVVQSRVYGNGVTPYTERFAFDALGRPSQASYIDGSTGEVFTFDRSYSAQTGLLETVTYPSSIGGYRHRVAYDYQYGQETRVRDVANGVVYWSYGAEDAEGRITREQLGNGLVTSRTFSTVTGGVTSIRTGIGGGSGVQSLSYRWDGEGNLLSRTDANIGRTETFAYDHLYRMVSAQVSGQPALTMSYAPNGNILSRSDVGNYAYSDGNHAHAVTAAGGVGYSYDANGNLVSRGGESVTWYASDLPRSIAGRGFSSSFEYGPDGRYWKQVASYSNGTETTRYLGRLLEVVQGPSVTAYRHQIIADGRPVALHTRGTNGAVVNTWLLTDHLRSTDVVTDAGGLPVVRLSFGAFGERRAPSWSGAPDSTQMRAIGDATRVGYTGHTMLDNVGIIHMNGRVYDPGIGRFLSPDPLTEAVPHTQRFNRYAYVNNRPLSLVDPSGYSPTTDSSMRLACSANDANCRQQSETPPEVVVTASRLSDSSNGLNVTHGVSGLGQVADRSAYSDRGRQAQTATAANPPSAPPDDAKPAREKQQLEDWMVLFPFSMVDAIIDDLTESWADAPYYALKAGTIFFGPGKGTMPVRGAAKAAAKVLSPNQMNKAIQRGQAPPGLERIDIGKVKGEQTHATFGSGAALNKDGTWKHGQERLTNAQKDWLRSNGWTINE